MNIEALLLMIPACFAINLIIGPNMLLSIRNGVQHGYMSSMVGMMGRLLAFVFYAIITVIGLGAIIASSALAFTIVKVIGAIYLVYIGIMSIKNGMNMGDLEATDQAPVNYFTLFKQEAVVGFTNPKIVLIFTALLPQFINAADDFNSQFFWLTLMFCFLEIVSTSIYVAAALLFADKFRSAKGQNFLSKSIGTFLIGFGMLMLTAKQ